jgi:hypothetical protein
MPYEIFTGPRTDLGRSSVPGTVVRNFGNIVFSLVTQRNFRTGVTSGSAFDTFGKELTAAFFDHREWSSADTWRCMKRTRGRGEVGTGNSGPSGCMILPTTNPTPCGGINMSATATANVNSLLTSIGFAPDHLNEKSVTVELVVDTFDVWQNSAISTEGPVMGCITCFRDPESDVVAA